MVEREAGGEDILKGFQERVPIGVIGPEGDLRVFFRVEGKDEWVVIGVSFGMMSRK